MPITLKDIAEKMGCSITTVPRALHNLMALGAMSAAQDRGFVAGKDISITGFDNIPMAEHSYPSLNNITPTPLSNWRNGV